MKRFSIVLCLAAVTAALFVPSPLLYGQENQASGHAGMMSQQQKMGMSGQKEMMEGTPGMMGHMKLGRDMRMLWEEHIEYTRNYIISALAGLGDVDAVAQRLLRNQDDIGNAIKPFYGEEAGKKLSMLLRDHIMIATEVVAAAKKNDSAALGTAQSKWTANADDIATFLSGANPNWPMASMQNMLHKHLELTTGECVSRLKMDWVADIDYYDKGHAHMMMFADMLTMGIAKQFPDKLNKK